MTVVEMRTNLVLPFEYQQTGVEMRGLTWFFPLSINRLVTLPKGTASETTSASETSMGILRMCRTREGPQGDLSPLNVVLSLPLAAGRKGYH